MILIVSILGRTQIRVDPYVIIRINPGGVPVRLLIPMFRPVCRWLHLDFVPFEALWQFLNLHVYPSRKQFSSVLTLRLRRKGNLITLGKYPWGWEELEVCPKHYHIQPLQTFKFCGTHKYAGSNTTQRDAGSKKYIQWFGR